MSSSRKKKNEEELLKKKLRKEVDLLLKLRFFHNVVAFYMYIELKNHVNILENLCIFEKTTTK